MREFFRGWRRKVGCVLLGVACVFLALWVRAHLVDDDFDYSLNDTRIIAFNHPDRIEMWSWNEAEVVAKLKAEPHIHLCFIHDPDGSPERWLLEGAIGYAAVSGASIWRCEILYWAVVWPVALLSAVLILWQPRTKGTRHA